MIFPATFSVLHFRSLLCTGHVSIHNSIDQIDDIPDTPQALICFAEPFFNKREPLDFFFW